MSVSIPEFRLAVLGSELAFMRTEHVRYPEDGSLSKVLGAVVAFGDDQRAYHLSVNSSGNGVSIRDWDPAPIDMGEYGVVVTEELPAPNLLGAPVSDLLSNGDGYQGSLTVCLGNGGRIIVVVAGDEVELEIVQPAPFINDAPLATIASQCCCV